MKNTLPFMHPPSEQTPAGKQKQPTSRAVSQTFYRKGIVAFVTACTIATAGCQRSNPSSSAPNIETSRDCQTITHEAGDTQVCGRPQKVITLGPSLLELLLTLEIQPIAHAEYFPFPSPRFDQPSQQIPYLGKRMTGQPHNVGSAENPSLDAIAKLKPDLILGDISKNKDDYALLSQIAPTLLFDYSGSETDWQSDLTTLGQTLQKTQTSKEAIQTAAQNLNKHKQDFKPIATQKPNVLLLLSEQINQGVRIETPKSSCGALLEEVGFQVIVPSELKQSDKDSHVVSLEALPALKADWILIQGFNSEFTALTNSPEEQQLQMVKKTWNENAITQSLRASKEEKVYFTTVYLCHALLGPIGTDYFLSDLRQQLLR